MIHVFLEKAKNLRSESRNETVNAMFSVDLCGRKEYSEVKNKVQTEQDQQSVSWYEHLFIDLKNLESDEVKEAQIAIKLHDKGLFRDQMVGCFDLDVAKIYSMNDQHALHNQWVAMNNPDS